ncbi:hypothetical protein LSTR_LSTR009960 [Laodelphax striatellus]|uniref:Uncharacterized protein n=1 Tax=Laodelphax striatellus TaxID=195883 RepID=A0A482XI47_LAOST|nr:hypothetical protein LSTR_LSTR009960 [Laodelphax striatellus]
MTTELNKFTLNNEIVLMRHDVRKARVCLAHKLTRTIQSLRKGKGSKEPTEKDLLKADKLLEEIRTLKKLKVDNITKTLLVYVDDPGKVLSDIRKSLEDRVMAKMFTIKSMGTSISKFRRKYPNWLEEVPALLKTMKKKSKTKIKEIPQKGTKSENNVDELGALKTKKCENRVGKPETLAVQKIRNNVEPTVSSTSGSWTVSGGVGNLRPVNGGLSKNGKSSNISEEKLLKILPNVGKISNNKKKFSENEESDGNSSSNAKRSRFNSDMESGDDEGVKKVIVSEEIIENRVESGRNGNKGSLHDGEKFESNSTKFVTEEHVNNPEERFKMGKKIVSRSRENGMDEDLERRFEKSKKVNEKVSDKKKEEMKVADPFFMTNDNSEYLTVVSSKEQAEALQNPSKMTNHHNDDEELYYGSSLTGGFKQMSHHERRKSSVTNLSRGSDRNNGDFREFGKGGGRNGENFRNREFGSSSSSHALPRRERRKLMNGGGKESKMEAEEKLHPSWEAKRRQSCPAIPQFSGKKIVFDD